MVIDDLIYGKLLDSLYPKSFLMTDEDGLQHEVIHYGDVKDAIEDLRIELKQRLEATCSKTEKVGDTISRQAAIDIVTFECGKWKGPAKEITKQISALPSVQPKRGHWMIEPTEEPEYCKCSECGYTNLIVEVFSLDGYHYCPNCGAKMERNEDGTDL